MMNWKTFGQLCIALVALMPLIACLIDDLNTNWLFWYVAIWFWFNACGWFQDNHHDDMPQLD